MRNFKKSFIVLFCLVAYSCGYQLQDTSSLAVKAGKVFIETNDPYSPFYKVLKNTMKINKISFSESRSSADTIIIINDADFKERVVTVSSSNYPKEYEINLEVTWSLTHQDQIIIEKAKYTEMGDYSFDRNRILGKVNESNFIKESLAEQVVEKIILRMSEVT